MSRQILAFAGSKGAGKSTAFETLKERGIPVHDVTLAGHLKTVVTNIFELSENACHDQVLKEAPLESPISLEPKQIEDLFISFGLISDKDYNYNDHIRPHIGKILETPRQLLQYLGTEVLHPIDPIIHANYVTKNLPKEGVIVITDLRFANEFDFFYENYKDEFVPFHIDNAHAEMMAQDDTHPSETDRHKFKHLCTSLDNNKSLGEFKELINNIKLR